MSIKLMSRVWEKQLTHSEQTILLAMADYADDNGRNCYPSYDRLAWKTGYSARQVARIVKGLCARGIVVVVKPPTQHNSAQYWIRIENAADKTPYEDFRVDNSDTQSRQNVQSENIQGGQMEHPGWTNGTSRVDMVSTDPSYNHHVEPINDDKDKGDAAVFAAWNANIPGMMTPILAERLHALIDECGAPSVIHGIVASVQANARSFNYVAKCARNHARGDASPQKPSKPRANPNERYFILDPVTGQQKEVSP